jgi:large-conductance mechanosensitive channel
MVLASPAASQVVPGILGFLVVAAMALALFFLLRSMNKQLNKVAREPRWREEAKQAQEEQQDQAQDYSHNGTPQQG